MAGSPESGAQLRAPRHPDHASPRNLPVPKGHLPPGGEEESESEHHSIPCASATRWRRLRSRDPARDRSNEFRADRPRSSRRERWTADPGRSWLASPPDPLGHLQGHRGRRPSQMDAGPRRSRRRCPSGFIFHPRAHGRGKDSLRPRRRSPPRGRGSAAVGQARVPRLCAHRRRRSPGSVGLARGARRPRSFTRPRQR